MNLFKTKLSVTLILTAVLALPFQVAIAATVESCNAGGSGVGSNVKVNGSNIVLHAAPDSKSAKLINQRATEAFKSIQYLTIDNSVSLVEECSKAGWSKVRVTAPDHLKETHAGWIPAKYIRIEKKDTAGKVEFTEADFNWNKKTTPYKKTIVAGVNKVHRENSQCKNIDTGSADISSTKGTRSDPVFYVACDDGSFNVFFSKSQIENDVKLVATKHIDKNQAMNACESYAKSKASHPSSVNFSRAMPVMQHPNGRTSVSSSFTAKNSFNLESGFNIRCVFEGEKLIDTSVTEKM